MLRSSWRTAGSSWHLGEEGGGMPSLRSSESARAERGRRRSSSRKKGRAAMADARAIALFALVPEKEGTHYFIYFSNTYMAIRAQSHED